MKSFDEIRSLFLDYFNQNDHSIMSSASLIPEHDPSLLFVNAGMVPFKPFFLGSIEPPHTVLCSAQRCIRAGGKHNDLENVGYTARHHTFFEMLGNFSFGAYFKRKAIMHAWRFLTEILALPADKLWVTVYLDDDEAADIWLKEVGVDPQRFSRCGKEDNFWSIGDTGPCGPCSEIFYDHGVDVPGGPPGSPNADGDRYIEIWNLVFMQFNAGSDGQLTPLPRPCVDTGMGLERLAAVLQGVHSNYETDLFKQLMDGINCVLKMQVDHQDHSLRVLADHLRSVCFLIADGVMPGNEGRSYVLRRIIRRAVRHGYALGQKEAFFYRCVSVLVAAMGCAYPLLQSHQQMIMDVIMQEELQFSSTLSKGLALLSGIMASTQSVIPGDVVFKLYDTYGFPPDLTADMAREHNLTLDYDGFEVAMKHQKQRSLAKSRFQAADFSAISFKEKSEFIGDQQLSLAQASVIGLYQNNKAVNVLVQGEDALVILDKTPFYPEGGGQVGDQGYLQVGEARFNVHDTQKRSHAIVHIGCLSGGKLGHGDQVNAKVNVTRRSGLRCHHSATHLLHAVLRDQLGDSVVQKGSLVMPDRLRFDFSYNKALTKVQLQSIEQAVNRMIRLNEPMHAELCSLNEAKSRGVMALFGEKYADQVRVIRFGDFSQELCGGSHVNRTGDIGLFKILSEGACAQGVRRIEAIVAESALNYVNWIVGQLDKASEQLKCSFDQLPERLAQLLRDNKYYQQQLDVMGGQLAVQKSGDILTQVQNVSGIQLLVANLDGVDKKQIRQSCDDLLNRLDDPAAVLLVSQLDSKVNLVAKVSSGCQHYFKASDLMNHVCVFLGGRGGGRGDMAQGGAPVTDKVGYILTEVQNWVELAVN